MKDLIIAACGSSRVKKLEVGIREAQRSGHNVWIALTIQAAQMVDVDNLRRLTGNAVVPGIWLDEDSPFPDEREVVVAPATMNTVSKLALGIADTPSTTVAAKNIGLGKPIVVAPSTDDGLRAHPKYARYKEELTGWGVDVYELGMEINHVEWWTRVIARVSRND